MSEVRDANFFANKAKNGTPKEIARWEELALQTYPMLDRRHPKLAAKGAALEALMKDVSPNGPTGKATIVLIACSVCGKQAEWLNLDGEYRCEEHGPEGVGDIGWALLLSDSSKTEPRFRILEPGELIQSGDSVSYDGGVTWREIYLGITKCGQGEGRLCRRPVRPNTETIADLLPTEADEVKMAPPEQPPKPDPEDGYLRGWIYGFAAGFVCTCVGWIIGNFVYPLLTGR